MSLLEAKGLACTFSNGTRAVKDLDFAIEAGELVGLIGPDGAGKTTIFRMLIGLQNPTGGTLTQHISRQQVGYVPQTFSLSPDLSVEENLLLQARLYGVASPEARIAHLLASVDLAPFRDRMAGALSGGMKQKLSLCSALLPEPRLLLLDEPTTGVDPVSRREFWSMLHTIHDEGVAVLFSTPYMDEAEYAHRMLLMHAGRILAEGGLDTFRANLSGIVLAITVPDRRATTPRLCLLDPLDISGEGDTVRARFPDQPLEPLLVRVQGVEGVTSARVSEASLEDCFLHLLVESDREVIHEA